MDKLKPCPFCGSEPNNTPNHTIICNTCHREVLPDVWQTRPIEDALQKRVEELNGEVKKWQDICTLSDDRAIVCIGNERALRTSLNEAVKEIEDSMQSADWEVASVYDGALLILKNHGLMEDK